MTDEKKRGTAAKVLMPLAATLASAAASYLAKKGPQYIEQLVPKVKDKAESATSGVGDVAHDLTERAKSVVSGDGGDGGGSPSLDELAKRRDERAAHRAARRKAS